MEKINKMIIGKINGETINGETKSIYHIDNIKFHFFHYLEECFEAFIAFVIYSLLTNNSKFELKKAIKVSLLVGLITFLLETYNPEIKKNIKTGMMGSIGSNLMGVMK
jgi:hypothetical protein